jgi:CBS-domain-containing membrane protein
MNEPNSRALPRWVARLARLQPWHLLTRFPNRWTRAGFAFLNGGVAIGILAGAAASTDQPLIFPALGPSAFLFFYQPSAPSSAPRNAILAHASALLIGWTAWELSGIAGGGGFVTVALTLGVTCAVMIAFGIPHPPAASTALMVTLGAVQGWQEIAAMLIGVVLLTLQALVFNRLAGISYPLWQPIERRAPGDFLVSALEMTAPELPGDPYASLADRLAKRGPLTQPRSAARSPGQSQPAAKSPFHPRPAKSESVSSSKRWKDAGSSSHTK